MAMASPMTKQAVVLEVGARFKGQASVLTLTLRCTSAALARVESSAPVIVISGVPRRFNIGNRVTISLVVPE